MANEENLKIESTIDLESEIPFTAIVDINQAKILLHNTTSSDKPNAETSCIGQVKTKLEENIDIRSICRICLSTENNMISLMSKTKHYEVADIFAAVTCIKVHPEENLPLQSCVTCLNDIIHCYEFKTKCCNADSFLRKIMNPNGHDDCKQQLRYLDKKDVMTQTTITDIKNESPSKINPVIIVKNKSVHKEDDVNKELKPKIEKNDDHEEIEYLEDDLFFVTDTDNEPTIENIQSELMSTEKEDLKIIKTKTTQKNKVKSRCLSCEVCSKKFMKLKTLRAHLKQCRINGNSNKKPYSCGQCKESFICESDLQIHSALHNKGNNWTCNKCLKEFTERTRFRRHIRRHMESKRYACESCDKTFAELCALRRHVRVHTGEEREKKYSCHLCEKRFCDSSQLGVHVARHTGARPCACDVCDKRFPSRRLLASHRRVHSDLKQYACLYCEKRFRHESTRNTHHRTHTGEKPFVCSICGKAFIQTSNLKLHMRTHTGEKPYTCDICERKFTSGSALTCHRRTHTGEKPYSCPVCGKRFARTDIRTHLRQHSGERPFACCACPKAFINAARLRDHYLIHTGEKPYECAICSEKFKRKNYLAKHIKTHERECKIKNKGLVILRQLPLVVDDNIIFAENDSSNMEPDARGETNLSCDSENKDVLVTEEIPIEVSGELILQEDSNIKTELVVVDNVQDTVNFQTNESIRLNENETYVNNEVNDVKLVTVNEDGVNISSSSVLEGTTMKLYQLDQSLVQIHTSGGQVTIRKITSKMTANF